MSRQREIAVFGTARLGCCLRALSEADRARFAPADHRATVTYLAGDLKERDFTVGARRFQVVEARDPWLAEAAMRRKFLEILCREIEA